MHTKILIVEDDESLMRLESIILASKGYTVLGVTTGPDALVAVAEESPDLILLDIMLPGLDGFAICKQIKRDIKTRDIPIIFITAKDTPEDIAYGKNIGGDLYITKPFKSAMVMKSVENLLNKVRTCH